MFTKSGHIELGLRRASADSCLPRFRRIKFCRDGFLLCENDHENFTVRYLDSSFLEVNSWTVYQPNGVISDYHYIGGALYVSFVNIAGEYDETYSVYKSGEDGKMAQVFSAPRESYQHDMEYFRLFEYRGECRLLLIRHNRVHLYSIGNPVRDINVLEGQKWYISNEHTVCAMGRDWELYDSSLELVTTFKFDEEADWLDVKTSKNGQLIALATNNSATEIGGLLVYDRQKDDFEIHYQRYGFYGIALCSGRVWGTIGSIYSGIGGLMIFDKNASLKFAHVRDETEADTLRAYLPSPIIHQSFAIEEISDNKVLILDYEKAVITDITCRPIQEIKHHGYDCFAISDDAKTLAILNIENRLYGGQPETEYNTFIDVYTWDSANNMGKVVDLTSFRK